jgi:hypothetical protein
MARDWRSQMPDENAPVLLEPSQHPDKSPRICSIRRRSKGIRARKPAISGSAIPETQKPHQPTDEERFEEYREDKSHESDVIQELMENARGVALILCGCRGEMDESLAWQLGKLLKSVVEPADAYYFGSLGDLNDAIGGRYLAVLLKRQLNAVRAKIAREQ